MTGKNGVPGIVLWSGGEEVSKLDWVWMTLFAAYTAAALPLLVWAAANIVG